jgi:hypothetical protein
MMRVAHCWCVHTEPLPAQFAEFADHGITLLTSPNTEVLHAFLIMAPTPPTSQVRVCRIEKFCQIESLLHVKLELK